jgi:hypothetical protein
MSEYVDEINAHALAEAIDDLRNSYEDRLTALENDIATMRGLIDSQSQVIGQTLQSVMGHGSTVKG